MFKRTISLLALTLLSATPSYARFISEDAHEGDAQVAPSLHRYLYSYQNPTAYVDPDGNFSVDAHSEMSEQAIKQAQQNGTLKGRDNNIMSRAATRFGVEVGSTEPDLTLGGSVPYQINRNINQTMPDEIIEEKARKALKPASEWVGQQQEKVIKKVAPDAYDTFDKSRKAFNDSDSIEPLANKIDKHLPGLNVKQSPLYRSHYGDEQHKHVMGKGPTKGIIKESVRGIVGQTAKYWHESQSGNDYEAGRALGNAMHTVQDSFSEGHVARGADGRIRKAFDFNGQSPQLHRHDDHVPANHPSRRAAIKATNEYLILAEEHRGDREGLRRALNEGIFATDIDETIPQPNQVRVTPDEAQQKVQEYIDSKQQGGQ